MIPNRVLNLGAGVQSTCLYLMGLDGEIEFDVAIFADTQDEPREVYDHVEFLKSLNGPPIVAVTAGRLGDNLINGMNSAGKGFCSIPTFLSIDAQTNSGIGRRQCTSEYKIEPITRAIREMLGLEKGQRAKKGTQVTQIFGLSFDEAKRVARVRLSYQKHPWLVAEFPLFDWMMTRTDCVEWLQKRLPGRNVPRSACVYCPFHTDTEWLRIKANPESWARAVEIDRAIRDKTSACARALNAEQFLHRSCKPLEEVEFKPAPKHKQGRMSFVDRDCEGMCGN